MVKRRIARGVVAVLLMVSMLLTSSVIAPVPVHALSEADFEIIWLKQDYSDAKGFSEGLAMVKQNDKWGYIDSTGNAVIPPIYDWTSDFKDGLARVSLNRRVGYIDKTGKEVIPFIYDKGWDFSEGLAAVEKQGKWGYINQNGEEVISFVYDEVREFHEGIAAVKMDGKWGFIDKEGTMLVLPQFDDVQDFSEGVASVFKSGDGVAFINRKGEVVIPRTYLDARSFREGLAAVFEEAWGFIDRTGKMVITFRFDTAPGLRFPVFQEGLAAVYQDGAFNISGNGAYGYINKIGDYVVPFIYDYASEFSEGLAVVRQNKKSGYIDAKGTVIIPLTYDSAHDFHGGLAMVEKGGKYAVLRNKTYKPVKQPVKRSNEDYIYDTTDAGDSANLPISELEKVKDTASAVSAVETAAAALTQEQKESTVGVDLLTLYSETAVSESASKQLTGSDVAVSQSSIDPLKGISEETKKGVEKAMKQAGVEVQRQIGTDVQFKTTTDKVVINVDPSAVKAGVDNIKVETPNYAVTLSSDALKKEVDDIALVITVKEVAGSSSTIGGVHGGQGAIPPASFGLIGTPGMKQSLGEAKNHVLVSYDEMQEIRGGAETAAANVRAFDVQFSKPITENIKLSLPALKGETKFQAVFNKKGEVIGGKYNPITKTIDVKINKADTYAVKVNKVDFSDIQGKTNEMKEAIRILASKGIINGVGKGKFNPNGTITRAEIATLLVKTLSKYDPSADGKFKDVLAKDWYFGAVGSAKQHGLMNGTSPTTFAPRDNITKDQIVAVSARVLKTEMKYKVPTDIQSILRIYKDAAKIAKWAEADVALATRENLVVKRYDETFVPLNTMTRGDVAVILYRLFKKLW